MVARIAWTVAASSCWFFAENGSMDGGMIRACSGESTAARTAAGRKRSRARAPGMAAGNPMPRAWCRSASPRRCDSAIPPARRPGQGRRQPGGLRVVQQHDIARADQPEQLVRVRGEDLRVVAGVGAAQRPAAGVTVNLVVQPLGDREEFRVAADHHPAGRDVQARAVPHEHLQHLGDPAADRGRIDVPDGPPAEPVPEPGGLGEQPRVPLRPDDRLEWGDRGSGTETSCSHPSPGARSPARGRAMPLAEEDGSVLTSSATLRPPG